MKENGLVPFRPDMEKTSPITWEQFVDSSNKFRNKLQADYDGASVKRNEYYRNACNGGYNFGKTVDWVVDYAPHPKALESIASALEAIAQFPNAGSVAWEMRRFIKFSSAHGYNSVPDVVKFGEIIKKIGDDDPKNEKGFGLDMDFFYWDSGWGVDGESTEEENIQRHCRNVTGAIDGLNRYAHPEIIEVERLPTQEEIEAQKREQEEQYNKDFLADAKSFYPHPSFFDIMKREELINRPYHKILTYPAEMADVANGGWINRKYDDPSDAMAHYYRELPYMDVKRADKNWFPSPLPPDYVNSFRAKFEKRLKRTSEQKPWLIDFSVKWQDVLQRSFVGGSHETNHAGEVELVYKNPKYNPNRDSLFNDEYEWRRLEPEEEKLFLESVVDIQPLANQQPAVKPPKQSWVFNGQTGTPYLFKLADDRKFNIFLKHEYGSIDWEGKIVIVAHDGPEPLFKYNNQQLKTNTTGA